MSWWKWRGIEMRLKVAQILSQLDSIISEYDNYLSDESTNHFKQEELLTRVEATFERLTLKDSPYRKRFNGYNRNVDDQIIPLSFGISILRALRTDYEAGYIQTFSELVHANLFNDFLEMADHLLEQGYKDPAAVIAGSVLEEHLRKLCDKNGIDVKKPDGTPKKADTLNSELAGANVYSKLDQKIVTAWLDLRNKAAHGKYTEYTKDQVALLIQSIRDFITRNPA
jgi:hypothetical protein